MCIESWPHEAAGGLSTMATVLYVVFLALLHKQERPIFDVLPSLYPIPSVLYVSFVAAAVAITPPGTRHKIGLSSSSSHPRFPLRGQPP